MTELRKLKAHGCGSVSTVLTDAEALTIARGLPKHHNELLDAILAEANDTGSNLRPTDWITIHKAGMATERTRIGWRTAYLSAKKEAS